MDIDKKWQFNIRLLAGFNFLTDFSLFAPVAILYFAKVSGSLALGMSIFSLVMLSQAVCETPTGIISDISGRKKTVIWGAIAKVIGYCLYAFGGNYWYLALGAIFEGVSRAFYSGNNDALLHDTLTESGKANEYAIFLGKTGSFFQIALGMAAIAGSVIANWSFKAVMVVSILPQALALILACFFYEPRVVSKIDSNPFTYLREAIRLFRENRKLQLITIGVTLRDSLGEAAYQFRAVFISLLWPVWAIGIANMLGNFGAAISFFVSGKIIKRFGAEKILAFETLFNRSVNLVALGFPNPVSPLLMSSTSMTFGLGIVATNSLMQAEFSDQQRATMGSLSSLVGSIGLAMAALGIGWLGDMIGPIKTLILVQLILFGPLLFFKRALGTKNENEKH